MDGKAGRDGRQGQDGRQGWYAGGTQALLRWYAGGRQAVGRDGRHGRFHGRRHGFNATLCAKTCDDLAKVHACVRSAVPKLATTSRRCMHA
eukprot:177633-Chlamydomonas_euryale.AAC.2